MKITKKARQIIGWVLVGYLVLHVLLNLHEVEVFFLVRYIEGIPAAFVILPSVSTATTSSRPNSRKSCTSV